MTPETPGPAGGQDADDLLVEARGLTKRYGFRTTAVAGLDLAVRRGEVYRLLLGPNGSGKSTTLRVLLGLVRPTSGTARVLGREPGDPEGLRRVGALVESPSFYPYLSGRDNLHAKASYAGVPPARANEALEAVKLGKRAGEKFKNFSLGIKQRLGIAAALLKDPELLVLDEPTNGLDPKGMADARAIVRKVGKGERTVLLCSHLLGEVEQTCDRVGIVREGEMVAEAPVAELRGGEGLAVRAEPAEEALCVALAGVEEAWVEKGGAPRLLLADPGGAARINAGLVSAGLRVSELRPVERSLEEAFPRLTAGRGARAAPEAGAPADDGR